MTETEITAIIGPHPFKLALRRLLPMGILLALFGFAFVLGKNGGWPLAMFAAFGLLFAVPMCAGNFLGTLTYIPTYKFLAAELMADKMSPGYSLGPQYSRGYLLIDSEKDIIAFGKSRRKLTELQRIEFNSHRNKHVIEFVFNSGDYPIVRHEMMAQDKAKSEFVKINNFLGFTRG